LKLTGDLMEHARRGTVRCWVSKRWLIFLCWFCSVRLFCRPCCVRLHELSARSSNESQAVLDPVMFVALAPAMLSVDCRDEVGRTLAVRPLIEHLCGLVVKSYRQRSRSRARDLCRLFDGFDAVVGALRSRLNFGSDAVITEQVELRECGCAVFVACRGGHFSRRVWGAAHGSSRCWLPASFVVSFVDAWIGSARREGESDDRDSIANRRSTPSHCIARVVDPLAATSSVDTDNPVEPTVSLAHVSDRVYLWSPQWGCSSVRGRFAHEALVFADQPWTSWRPR